MNKFKKTWKKVSRGIAVGVLPCTATARADEATFQTGNPATPGGGQDAVVSYLLAPTATTLQAWSRYGFVIVVKVRGLWGRLSALAPEGKTLVIDRARFRIYDRAWLDKTLTDPATLTREQKADIVQETMPLINPITVAWSAGPDELPPPLQLRAPKSTALSLLGEDRFQTVNEIYRYPGKPEDKRWDWPLDINHSVEYWARPNLQVGAVEWDLTALVRHEGTALDAHGFAISMQGLGIWIGGLLTARSEAYQQHRVTPALIVDYHFR